MTPELINEARRAALLRIADVAAGSGGSYTGPPPERLGADIWVCVNGVNITPAIDAAVQETYLRMRYPDTPAPKTPRPWWKFWRRQ